MIYRNSVWPIVAQDLIFRAKHGGFHGSEVRDIILRNYPKSGTILDSADSLLKEMVENGDIKPYSKATPSISQRAFAGLFYKDYSSTGWAAGTREHFYYETSCDQSNRCIR